jgi:hypothetical protein
MRSQVQALSCPLQQYKGGVMVSTRKIISEIIEDMVLPSDCYERNKKAVKRVQSFRRKFADYFGIALRKGWNDHYCLEKNEMRCDLGTREIEYSSTYSSEDAAVAVLFHEIGHFIFEPASRKCSMYVSEKRCWDVGFSIMTGVFGIQRTKEMDDVMEKCLDTYKAPRRKRCTKKE